MVVFLTGTPGIGKTTVARELGGTHIEFDQLRFRLGANTTTNSGVEDAINWRALTLAIDAKRTDPEQLVIIDSTGASKRLPYLRYALGEYAQVLVRLTSAFPFAPCARKWGQAYSQAQFDHLLKKVMELPADIELSIDGRTPAQTAAQLRALLQGR